MTERGSRVRWTTAALVAPAAAAVFTGTTVWAAGHQPASTSTAQPAAAAVADEAAAADPVVLELQAAVEEARAQVADLRAGVTKLAKQANAVIKGQKAATVAIASTTRSRSGSSAGSTSGSSSSRPAAPKKTSAPPPSQGSTGASG